MRGYGGGDLPESEVRTLRDLDLGGLVRMAITVPIIKLPSVPYFRM
jgi:hypothetical protein